MTSTRTDVHKLAPLTSHCSQIPLVHGVRDLFWLPIEQYRKDGRIIRGLQRGAASFGTSTASAALELSNRLVQAIQVLPADVLFNQVLEV